jgi:hypothetical protein
VICPWGSLLPSRRKPDVRATDRELLDTIMRDLRAIYTDVIRQPLPPELAAALVRLETRTALSEHEKPRAA